MCACALCGVPFAVPDLAVRLHAHTSTQAHICHTVFHYTAKVERQVQRENSEEWRRLLLLLLPLKWILSGAAAVVVVARPGLGLVMHPVLSAQSDIAVIKK